MCLVELLGLLVWPSLQTPRSQHSLVMAASGPKFSLRSSFQGTGSRVLDVGIRSHRCGLNVYAYDVHAYVYICIDTRDFIICICIYIYNIFT